MLWEAMQCIKYLFGVTWGSKDRFAKILGLKVTSSSMDLLKEKIMQCWNPKFKKVKVWQRWSDSRFKWLKCVLFLILSICMPYYQEGCNIDHLTWSKVLIGHPSENPERKPCETNSRIFRWSSCDLVDQITLINLGLDFSGLDRSDQSRV